MSKKSLLSEELEPVTITRKRILEGIRLMENRPALEEKYLRVHISRGFFKALCKSKGIKDEKEYEKAIKGVYIVI